VNQASHREDGDIVANVMQRSDEDPTYLGIVAMLMRDKDGNRAGAGHSYFWGPTADDVWSQIEEKFPELQLPDERQEITRNTP